MYKLRRRQPVLALLGVVLLIGLVGAINFVTSAPAPWLSSDDLALFHVYDAVDLTSSEDTGEVEVAISRDFAEQAARSEVDSDSKDIRTYLATGYRYLDQPARSVWVVEFKGSFTGLEGPIGAPEPKARQAIYGVLIDATTGEVWGGFIH
jgi:hypothetical protein